MLATTKKFFARDFFQSDAAMKFFYFILATISLILLAIFLYLLTIIRSLAIDNEIISDQDIVRADIRRYYENQGMISTECAPAIYSVDTGSVCSSDIRPHFDSSICEPALSQIWLPPLTLVSPTIRYKVYVASLWETSDFHTAYRKGAASLRKTTGDLVGFEEVYCKDHDVYVGIFEFTGKTWPW
jgi:hypothetical protein